MQTTQAFKRHFIAKINRFAIALAMKGQFYTSKDIRPPNRRYRANGSSHCPLTHKLSICCQLIIMTSLAIPFGTGYATGDTSLGTLSTSSSSTTSASTNASTDPSQPSTSDILGIPNNNTGAGNTASCAAGTGDPACAGAGNPINVMTGNKYQVETDLAALPGMMGIEIVRHYNSLHMSLGQIGYGWRLGYEIDLTANVRSIYITQADGSQTIFNRSVFNPSDCACQDPAQGHVMIYHTPQGDEYTWFKLDGKQLHFNHLGKLERMSAPTGESMHFERGPKGELLKVTDPQGRSLILHYADKHSIGFKGIIAIDSPVGRYNYQHNNDPQSKGISNLIQVRYPQSGQPTSTAKQSKPAQSILLTKIYSYGETDYVDAHMATVRNARPQIPQAGHLLTGISFSWQDDSGQLKTVRQRTWKYDALGRGILSVHGYPEQRDAQGLLLVNSGTQQVKVSYLVIPLKDKIKPRAKSLPSVNTDYPRITRNGQVGQTIITNSAGQTTTYNYTLIAGQYRLLQILGAGCAECAETNIVYGYDKLGRQTDVTRVALNPEAHKEVETQTHNSNINRAKQPSTHHIKPIHPPEYVALTTTHADYDASGRVLTVSRIDYQHGKALPSKRLIRYSYPATPSFPQLNQAQRGSQEPLQIYSQPSLIAKPSVVEGQEHQWHISYNSYGQPTKITETGYAPAIQNSLLKAVNATKPEDQAKSNSQLKPEQTSFQMTDKALPISRAIRYSYTRINGRSLLSQIDAPLPNGKTNSPQDSDITQYQYDKYGQYLTRIIAPNNVITQLAYDTTGAAVDGSEATGGTGRVVKVIANNGITNQFDYNAMSKIVNSRRYPASLSIAAAKDAGLLQVTTTHYDVFGNTSMVKRADEQAVFMQYGDDGKLTAMRDDLGNRVEWKEWMLAKHQKDERVTTQQWFTADKPDTVSRAWYFWHDNQNRLKQRLSPDGGLDTWRYSNNHTSEADQALQAEAANDQNWVEHIDPLNRTTLNVANNQGSAQVRMTPDGYMDASLRLHTNTVNATELGRQSTSQSSNQLSQEIDDFGRVIQFSSPQHGTHTAQYNAADRIIHIVQPDGTQIHYVYDAAGRLLTKTALAPQSNTTDTVHYAYNAFGLSQVSDALQTLTYKQDLLGREVDKATTLKLNNGLTKAYHIHTRYTVDGKVKAKQLINGDWLVFTLDDKTGLTKAMRLHKTIWPSLTNKLANWLNMPDLPLQIATTETVVTDITVHPFNGITHITHGNGIADDYSFDIAGRLTTVSHGIQPQDSKTNSPFIKASYTYDAGKRLTSEQISTADLQGKVKAYAYTGWNDFTTPPKSGFIKAVANTATNRNETADETSATFANAKSAAITLDQAGRTATDIQYRYSYNAWGKLATVQNKTNNQTLATYQSNALGERVMASYAASTNKDNSPQTRYYLYDHQQRVAELDEQGNVLQQYLYINQTPVAVINTPTEQIQESDKQSAKGIIAIHTDRRHAPIAATDEHGKVVWQAAYDAWGKLVDASYSAQPTVRGELVEPQPQNKLTSFNLALRLPGQWQDPATSLYYNYQRDYNPDTGSYLTADPLGFPDGADPYAYVNNDPLNKVDPLGLYEIDIHYYMTYFLGLMAGLTEYQAHVVALGAQYVDDNPFTQPLPHSLPQAQINIALENPAVVNRLASYHFTQAGYDKLTGNMTDVIDRINNPNNPQLTRLLSAANANYKGAPCKVIKEQLFGEYLHAFEDTFGHRDQDNVPIEINGGYGHGLYGHEPDKTYSENVTNAPFYLTKANGLWWTRELRTLEMEKEVFAKIQQNFGVSGINKITNKKITVDDITATLEKFNAIHESEQSTNNLFSGTQKLKVLNDFLIANGFSAIPIYNLAQACKFRQNTVVDLAGNPPPGVILDTPLNCKTTR